MTVDQKSPHAVILTKPSDLEFRVERVFDHPIERVWAAYTDPALIPQWWGQGTTVDRFDLRAGGGYRFVSNAAPTRRARSSATSSRSARLTGSSRRSGWKVRTASR